jgi:hypothetical protein
MKQQGKLGILTSLPWSEQQMIFRLCEHNTTRKLPPSSPNHAKNAASESKSAPAPSAVSTRNSASSPPPAPPSTATSIPSTPRTPPTFTTPFTAASSNKSSVKSSATTALSTPCPSTSASISASKKPSPPPKQSTHPTHLPPLLILISSPLGPLLRRGSSRALFNPPPAATTSLQLIKPFSPALRPVPPLQRRKVHRLHLKPPPFHELHEIQSRISFPITVLLFNPEQDSS